MKPFGSIEVIGFPRLVLDPKGNFKDQGDSQCPHHVNHWREIPPWTLKSPHGPIISLGKATLRHIRCGCRCTIWCKQSAQSNKQQGRQRRENGTYSWHWISAMVPSIVAASLVGCWCMKWRRRSGPSSSSTLYGPATNGISISTGLHTKVSYVGCTVEPASMEIHS